jgi:hypothetical protein
MHCQFIVGTDINVNWSCLVYECQNLKMSIHQCLELCKVTLYHVYVGVAMLWFLNAIPTKPTIWYGIISGKKTFFTVNIVYTTRVNQTLQNKQKKKIYGQLAVLLFSLAFIYIVPFIFDYCCGSPLILYFEKLCPMESSRNFWTKKKKSTYAHMYICW